MVPSSQFRKGLDFIRLTSIFSSSGAGVKLPFLYMEHPVTRKLSTDRIIRFLYAFMIFDFNMLHISIEITGLVCGIKGNNPEFQIQVSEVHGSRFEPNVQTISDAYY
jgi:hypothetical protein